MISRIASLFCAAALLTACAASPDSTDDVSAPPEDVNEAAAQLLDHDLAQIHGQLIPQTSKLTQALYKLGARDWLTWAMALPYSTGPITDTTGAACAQGQSGPVWFLAGTPGGSVTRSCAIPKGKVLVLPLINNWVIASADQVATPEQMADYLAFVNDYLPGKRAQTCELHLSIDGIDVGGDQTHLDQKLWTQVLDPFSVVLDDDNFASQWGVPGGVKPAATIAGHFALITPLAAGNHVIELGGSMCDDTNAVVFETSAVYQLSVN